MVYLKKMVINKKKIVCHTINKNNKVKRFAFCFFWWLKKTNGDDASANPSFVFLVEHQKPSNPILPLFNFSFLEEIQMQSRP